jgi:hypothetical protein
MHTHIYFARASKRLVKERDKQGGKVDKQNGARGRRSRTRQRWYGWKGKLAVLAPGIKHIRLRHQ